MSIGAFSLSLTVKDLQASKEFYEKLGFSALGGDEENGWLILKNEDCVIGLFQGMFEKNMLTFNPGWNSNAEEVNPFRDVRALQEDLKAKGIKFITEADTSTEGPAHFVIEDPDGNPILVDQHR
ncbi:Catechol 2,3-dioxygenase [Bhargavaea ginsengi]|uniref:Catechol 2,3-dioxygenase n=1 Tax=Bhargavaea ginsengi TaxID=426757 RepID=A0A1H7AWQ3_9BACL|nr:VOC family protein [Bhargavaea ginsengi]MCM3088036.1 VOC family protein [Bhargavaea ginsengi]SEJ70019.1 Catechol 2,3-dioxygenase [Bhargavaea ginsengi]